MYVAKIDLIIVYQLYNFERSDVFYVCISKIIRVYIFVRYQSYVLYTKCKQNVQNETL